MEAERMTRSDIIRGLVISCVFLFLIFGSVKGFLHLWMVWIIFIGVVIVFLLYELFIHIKKKWRT